MSYVYELQKSLSSEKMIFVSLSDPRHSAVESDRAPVLARSLPAEPEIFPEKIPACGIRPESGLILEQREHLDVIELRAAIQEFKFHDHADAHHLSAELARQPRASPRCAAGGEQVIDNQNTVSLAYCVAVDLQRVGSIFQVIADARRLRRKLVRLAHWDKPRAEPVGQRRSEYEPARFDSQDQINPFAGELRRERIDERAESVFFLDH